MARTYAQRSLRLSVSGRSGAGAMRSIGGWPQGMNLVFVERDAGTWITSSGASLEPSAPRTNRRRRPL